MRIFFTLSFSCVLLSCAQPIISVKQYRPSGNLPLPQEDLLCIAYRTDSLRLLEQFFVNWQTERAPLSPESRSRLPEIHRAVYQVFEDFCNYKQQKYSNAYPAAPFCMIQNEILFKIDTLAFDLSSQKYEFTDTIKDFRPLPPGLHAKVVYATPRYEKLLDNFIKGDCPASGKRKYEEPWPGWPRANFLEQIVHLSASLDGFHYHILPRLSVRLNNSLSRAIVYSNHGSVWQIDLFKRDSTKWEYIEQISRFIE